MKTIKERIANIFHRHIYGYTEAGLEIYPINQVFTIESPIGPIRYAGGFLEIAICPKCGKEFRERVDN